VLLAAPLRLVSDISFAGLVSMTDWDQAFRPEDRTADELAHLGSALVIVAVPAAGVLWFALTRRRWAAVVVRGADHRDAAAGLPARPAELSRERPGPPAAGRPRPEPPVSVHSGSQDVCPGG